jgi:hypothetical protein
MRAAKRADRLTLRLAVPLGAVIHQIVAVRCPTEE